MLVIASVTEPVPPDAVIVWLYPTPTAPGGSAGLRLIAGLTVTVAVLLSIEAPALSVTLTQ